MLVYRVPAQKQAHRYVGSVTVVVAVAVRFALLSMWTDIEDVFWSSDEVPASWGVVGGALLWLRCRPRLRFDRCFPTPLCSSSNGGSKERTRGSDCPEPVLNPHCW